MSIIVDNELAVKDNLQAFNLMNLPLETLHHVLSFLTMKDVVNFAFVCQRAFQAAKALTWDNLDFTPGDYWPEDVENFCVRSQATCQSLVLPLKCWWWVMYCRWRNKDDLDDRRFVKFLKHFAQSAHSDQGSANLKNFWQQKVDVSPNCQKVCGRK
jgi:hypothetical protein